MSDIACYTCPEKECAEIIWGTAVSDPDLPAKIAAHKHFHTPEGQRQYIRRLEGYLHHAQVRHGAGPTQCTDCYALSHSLR